MATINLTLTVEVPGCPDREIVENVIRDHVSMLCGFHKWECVIAEDKPPDLADVSPIADCFARSNENIPAYFALDSLVSILFSVGEIRRFLAWWNDVKTQA